MKEQVVISYFSFHKGKERLKQEQGRLWLQTKILSIVIFRI